MKLHGTEFYDAVGRPDLAASYRSRLGGKIFIRAVAAPVILFGLMGLFEQSWDHLQIVGDSCQEHSSCVGAWPQVALLVGLAIAIAPAAIDADPVDERGRYALAYEAALRPVARPQPPPVSLAPRFDRDGAGLTLSARF
jgi:hypothetical protein